MQYLSSSSIFNNLSTILEIVKQEPVIISQEQEEVAIVLSMKEYQKILSNNIRDFQYFCDQVGQKAQEKGLTEEKLFDILTND
jgi:prevent-host-death family protein